MPALAELPCIRPCECVAAESGAIQLRRRLTDGQVVAVIDAGAFVGVLTVEELLRSPKRLLLDCVRKTPILSSTTTVPDAVRVMTEGRHAVLPVCREGQFLGIVFLDQLKAQRLDSQSFERGRGAVSSHPVSWANMPDDQYAVSPDLISLRAAAVQTAQIGFFCMDHRARIIDVNPALLAMLHYSDAQSIYGQRGHCLLKERACRRRIIETLFADGHVTGHSVARRKDGAALPVHYRVVRLWDESRAKAHYLCTLHDVSMPQHDEEPTPPGAPSFCEVVTQASVAMLLSCPVQSRVLFANQKACDLFGYSAEELYGLPGAHLVHPDDMAGYKEARAGIRQAREPIVRLNHRMLNRDGRSMNMDVAMCGIRNATGEVTSILTLFLNARECACADAASDACQEQLDFILRQMPIMVFQQDHALRFSSMYDNRSPGQSRMMIGKTDAEIMHSEDAAVLEQVKRRILECGEADSLTARIRSDAGERYYDMALEPVRNNAGEITGIRGVALHVTDQERMRRELQQQHMHLARADALHTLGMLAAEVAHEIGNRQGCTASDISMLQDIWNSVTPILDRYEKECGCFQAGGIPYSEARECFIRRAQMIQAHIDAIGQIIRQLKYHAQVRDTDVMQLFSLNKVVDNAIMLCREAIRRTTDHFTCVLMPHPPVMIGDERRLEQAVVNLLLNACQALPSAERAVSVTTGIDPETNSAFIAVEDEGCGIPPEHVDSVTKPFFTTKKETGGMGLGLSIVERIAKSHGGRLAIESRSEMGTVATIYLPLKEGNAV